MTMLTKRTVLATAMAAGLTSSLGGVASAQTKRVTVRIGFNPFAGTAGINGIIQERKLYEKYAAKYGYSVVTDWKQFIAGGPPANAAMMSGNLDIDMDISSAALTARIKQGVPFVVFGIQASHISNAVMVRPGGGIDEVAKLEGKTIGLPVGTSAHYTLASVIRNVLGKSIEQARIKVVNMPPNVGIQMPAGVDAVAVWVPFRFQGPDLGTADLLVDSDGFTGKTYKSPGGRLPETKKAWGWPEGFFTDRLYLSARQAFANEHPDLLRAFLEADWEAQEIVSANQPQAIEIANRWWKLKPEIAQQSLETYAENDGIRTAPVVLEYDALTLIKTSEFFHSLGTIDSALTWKEIKPLLSWAADIQKAVWESRGSRPSIDEMKTGFHGTTKYWPDLSIAGGAPVWQWAETPQWGERFYKPGPFGDKQ
jgi:ABC-type nitrate/sulfonate/bicarbonate transport system substrate-binding protein